MLEVVQIEVVYVLYTEYIQSGTNKFLYLDEIDRLLPENELETEVVIVNVRLEVASNDITELVLHPRHFLQGVVHQKLSLRKMR